MQYSDCVGGNASAHFIEWIIENNTGKILNTFDSIIFIRCRKNKQPHQFALINTIKITQQSTPLSNCNSIERKEIQMYIKLVLLNTSNTVQSHRPTDSIHCIFNSVFYLPHQAWQPGICMGLF